MLFQKKKCYCSSAFFGSDFDIFDAAIFLSKIQIQNFRSRVKVTDAILGKNLVMDPVLFWGPIFDILS